MTRYETYEDLLRGDDAPADMRPIQTPEGVPLKLTIAPIMQRLVAFSVDMTIIAIALGILVATMMLFMGTSLAGWLGALLLLATFLVRNFYFVWFELHNQGTTPGKRLAGVRVIDVHGRSLTANAIFVRNVTRDLELFLPLLLLIHPAALWEGGPLWAQYLAGAWVLVLGLVPFFNRDKLRVGDLMAGTMVVNNPTVHLLEDMGVTAQKYGADAAFGFTDEELDLYGIYELQTLEDLLRRDHELDYDSAYLVAHKIASKIDYDDTRWKQRPREFLNAFYLAQRGKLENKMLLGDRRERKKK